MVKNERGRDRTLNKCLFFTFFLDQKLIKFSKLRFKKWNFFLGVHQNLIVVVFFPEEHMLAARFAYKKKKENEVHVAVSIFSKNRVRSRPPPPNVLI